MKQVFITRKGDEVAIKFGYERDLVRVAKDLEKRRFDPETKEWLAPLHHYKYVVKEFEAANCLLRIDPSIEELLMNEVDVQKKLPVVHIQSNSAEYQISFEYDEQLVRTMKALPEKRFDPVLKMWAVPIRDREKTLEQILYRLKFVDCEVSIEGELARSKDLRKHT
ncbi:MAG: hypothetical protein ACE5IJ_00535 [Thermoplasmata archaeon]